jgi:cellulose synthase operon protein YhjQ
MVPSEFGVACLPYGEVEESQREAFESLLSSEPGWVGTQIELTGLGNDAVVFIDTPPGPSTYLKQVLACADLVLVIQLPDAGSYATLPAMEACLYSQPHTSGPLKYAYVLNQVDRTDPLNRDVADLISHLFGERLAPIRIHRDEAVREAVAFQQPVLVYAPHGQASNDLASLAEWVIDTLNR